jgi:hypothetical protein
MIASTYPLLNIFVSTLYFAILIAWIILVFHVFQDIMRSHDITGSSKALWVLFILVLPLLGCLLYLIVRGGDMHRRQERAMQVQRDSFEDYIRHVATTTSEHTHTPTP